MNATIVLGASDDEMRAIDQLAAECGIPVAQATRDGRPVRPGEVADGPAVTGPVLAVEVAGPWGQPEIDHHGARPEASWGPKRFLAASAIGQVIAWLAQHPDLLPASWPDVATDGPVAAGYVGDIDQLADGRWAVVHWECDCATESYLGHSVAPRARVIPDRLVFVAAADHCIAAAFAGQCPGVDPTPGGAFWRHIVDGRRLTFAPDMTAAEYSAVVEASLATLRAAPDHPGLPGLADLTALPIDGPVVARTGEQYPSLFQFGPLIGSIGGRAYITRVRLRTGEIAFRLGGAGAGTAAGEDPIRLWLAGEGPAAQCWGADAPAPRNLYGSPARGYAGGTCR